MIPRSLVFAVASMSLMTIVMAMYAWHVRSAELHNAAATLSGGTVGPPAAGPTEQVTLYVAYDDPGSLRAQGFRIPLPSGRQQRAEELLRDLVNLYQSKASPHPIAPDSEVRSVYLVDPNLAVIDINSDFANGQRSGIFSEDLIIASLVETLSENLPGITRVKILVDGKSRDTLAGHADLTGFYDASSVKDLAAQLAE